MKNRSKEVIVDICEVALFVFKDTATLLIFILGLKIYEMIMGAFFAGTHPYTELLTQLSWAVFFSVYCGLIVFDIFAFLKRKKRRLDHEVWD